MAQDLANLLEWSLLNAHVAELRDRMELLEIIMAPKMEDRMFQRPYQIKTIDPDGEAEVYRQDVPEGFAGVITRIGNDWFPNTVISRVIDSSVAEQRIERSLAPVTDPIAVKIFVKERIVWRAQNNDGIAHTFGVLTDGFFIPKRALEAILALEKV